MIELGRKQTLYMDHKTDFGVYLSDRLPDADQADAGRVSYRKETGRDRDRRGRRAGDKDPRTGQDFRNKGRRPDQSRPGKQDKKDNCVLLPARQVPQGLAVGDQIEVFVYRDSEDRLIATVRMPMLELGGLAVLEVREVTGIGAFLDWGLEKDLLLPFSEQTKKVQKGDKYLVSLYVDKSDRLCATMKVYDFLRTDSPYKADDQVKGIVFGMNPEYGCFVAVDRLYVGMIPQKELVRRTYIGQEVDCRVMDVREDGKLNLSLRKKAYLQIDEDSRKIMEKLQEYGGSLPYHDKSSPEEIRGEFAMSKNEFKRAIGRLYKMKKILITDEGIKLV